jgi:hypothetical protein
MTPINVRNRNRLGMNQPSSQAISRKTMEKLGQAAHAACRRSDLPAAG